MEPFKITFLATVNVPALTNICLSLPEVLLVGALMVTSVPTVSEELAALNVRLDNLLLDALPTVTELAAAAARMVTVVLPAITTVSAVPGMPPVRLTHPSKAVPHVDFAFQFPLAIDVQVAADTGAAKQTASTAGTISLAH